MKRLFVAILVAVSCLTLSACSPAADSPSAESASPKGLEALIPSLTEGESASLDHVSMTRSQGGSVEAGTHEDELLAAGFERADIGLHRQVNGIDAVLVVPMWYGPESVIQVTGQEPEAMLEAVEATATLAGQSYWFGDPVASVEFHLEQGVLVIDRVAVPLKW